MIVAAGADEFTKKRELDLERIRRVASDEGGLPPMPTREEHERELETREALKKHPEQLFALLNADMDDLTADDFDNALGQYKNGLLLLFFAPWCRHSQEFAPNYERIAGALQHADPPVRVARIDATQTQSQHIAQRYGVTGFPWLVLFLDGKPIHFPQERTLGVGDVVDWVGTRSGRTAEVVHSYSQLMAIKRGHGWETLVLGLFGGATDGDDEAEGPDARAFRRLVAKSSDFFNVTWALAHDPRLVQNQLSGRGEGGADIPIPAIKILRRHDANPVYFSPVDDGATADARARGLDVASAWEGAVSSGEAKRRVARAAVRRLDIFSPAKSPLLFGTGAPWLLCLFLDSRGDSTRNVRYMSAVQEASERLEKKLDDAGESESPRQVL